MPSGLQTNADRWGGEAWVRTWAATSPVDPAAATVTQIAAIAMYVVPLGTWADGLKFAVLMAAVVLTLFTGVQYAAFALAPPQSSPEKATG